MELKGYIEKVIAEVLDGVSGAKERYGVKIAPGFVNGKPVYSEKEIKFEVKITVSADGKAGLKVLSVAELGGQASREVAQTVSFSVPVYFNDIREEPQ